MLRLLDTLGFSASFICAVHCVAMPFILSMGALSGATWLESPLFEWGLIGGTLFVALWSLSVSYRKHKNLQPLVSATFGFLLLITSHHDHDHHNYYMAALGGLAVAYAHYRNWKLLAQSGDCTLPASYQHKGDNKTQDVVYYEQI